MGLPGPWGGLGQVMGLQPHSPPHAAGVILFEQSLTIFVHLASASQLATLGKYFFCNFLLKDFGIFFFPPG